MAICFRISDFGFRIFPSPPMITRAEQFAALIALSHDLGAEHRRLAILGEGNTSAKLSRETFLVKASGSSLGTLGESDIVECRSAPLLAMLDRTDLSDQQIEDELFACRVDPDAKKPSVEALFHAFFLSLEGIAWVGHTHPISVNQVLCSGRGADFATRRLFPDEIVCCGLASVFIPYTDPGLKLAQTIRTETLRHCQTYGAPPRVVLLENHGIITLGASQEAVKAAMFMADKAAQIFIGAAALGGPRFLTPAQGDRIANRIDEHYRQRALRL
jgi:rhamnose utilization protein RhaD (predicted bifunctional aldolase and dehydrogenase)